METGHQHLIPDFRGNSSILNRGKGFFKFFFVYVAFKIATNYPSIDGLLRIVTKNSVDLGQRLSCLVQNETTIFIQKSVKG